MNKRKIFKTKIIFIFGIVLLSILVASYFCIPLYNNILQKGSDTGFHLTRIQAWRDAILEGVKYPYIWWHANFDFGYPTPLYYCQLLLFPAVYLISIGFSLVISYKIYIFLLIAAATFSIGLAQKHISKNKIHSIVVAMFVYLINSHEIISIFRRSALGELMAAVFIPTCLLGIYYVLYSDYEKWFYLVIGFTGIVLSHNISFVIMCIIFLIFIIINLKTLFNEKERIYSIIKAVICTFLLSIFFTFPMLEGLSNNKMYINNGSNTNYIEGISIKELFDFSCTWNIYANLSPGPFLLFVPLLSIFVKNKRKENKFIFDCLIIGYVLVFCMTKYFPWQLFKFMSFMQFSSRLLPPICALLALSGSYYFEKFLSNFQVKQLKTMASCILILLVFVSTYHSLTETKYGMYGYSNSMTLDEAYEELYKPFESETFFDSQQLSSGDYLPVNNIEYTTYEYYEPSISSSNSINDTSAYMEIDDALIDKTTYYHYVFIVNSNKNYNTTIGVPRTYYSGYKVKAYSNGKLIKEIEPYADERNGILRFEAIKSDSPITYDVYYEVSNIQKYSMKISIVSVVFVPAYIIYDCFVKKRTSF